MTHGTLFQYDMFLCLVHIDGASLNHAPYNLGQTWHAIDLCFLFHHYFANELQCFLQIVLPNILDNGKVILAFLVPPLAPKHRKIVNSRRNPQQVRPNCCIWRSQHFFIAKNIQYLNRPQILLNHNMTNKCLQPIGIVVSPPISCSVACFACEWYVWTLYPNERGTPTDWGDP